MSKHEATTHDDEREYVLGTDDDELARLGFQHQVWGAQALRGWERAGFKPGDTILDVGCGPGYASFDMARLVGATGRVIAVDVSRRFLAHLESQARARGVRNVEMRLADVEELDIAESSVDGAYARWVLTFVGRPEAVVEGVARALKPGGAFVVQDYSNYTGAFLAPQSAITARVFEAVAASFRARGGDPDVASRVPTLMERCGLRVTEINPLIRIARPGSALWHWPVRFFSNYLPALVASGGITEAERVAFNHEWDARANDPASFFSTPPVAEIIGVKK